MSPRFWRIARIGGIISLLIIYIVWWGRMISHPVERNSADFFAFYAAGRVAQIHGLASVYTIELQQQVEQEVVGFPLAEGQVLLYNHMPYLVPFLMLVVSKNYVASFVRWSLFLIGFYLTGSIYFVKMYFADESQSVRLTVASVMLTFFPLFISLWQGQDTAILYLGIGLWCMGILKKQDWLTAAGLTLATIRPHIAMILFMPLLFRGWGVLWRFVFVSGVLAGISVLILGIQGVLQFVNLLLITAQGDWFGMNQFAMLNLLGLIKRVLPFIDASALSLIGWIIFLGGIIGVIILWARSGISDERVLGLTILIAALTVPHLQLHDLTILVFPLLFIAKRGMSMSVQPQWALLPLGASFILLVGMLWNPIRFVLPYIMFAMLIWAFCSSPWWRTSLEKRPTHSFQPE